MHRLLVTFVLAVVACGCRTNSAEKSAITPVPVEKRAPTVKSWLSSLKQAVTIRIEAPASDAEAIKPFVALGERYRKVKPDVTVTATTGATRRIEIAYGGKTIALGPEDGVQFTDVAGTSYLIARTLHQSYEAAEGIKHRIGFLVGNKQSGLDELKTEFAKARPSYVLEPVEALEGEKSIAPELEALIVSAPREPTDPRTMRPIDEFLMRGRSVAILSSHGELRAADPSMNLRLDETPMARLLAGYGLTVAQSLVIDKRALWMVPGAKKGAKPEIYPFVVMADAAKGAFDSRVPALFAQQTLPLAFASEITVATDRATRNGAKVTTLLRTGEDLVIVDGSNVSMHPAPEKIGNGYTKKHDEKRAAALAVTIEGAIGSAFDKPGDGAKGAAGGRARLLVLSAAGFLGNPFRDAARSPFGGMMPGMDPHLGEDEELMEFAKHYDALAQQPIAATARICDWLLRRDQEIERVWFPS